MSNISHGNNLQNVYISALPNIAFEKRAELPTNPESNAVDGDINTASRLEHAEPEGFWMLNLVDDYHVVEVHIVAQSKGEYM